ncbi:hypothetical protein [Micromonospora echinofusca]|uniref:DUF2262 domain-containing protein n=1 Tax=Micromonospora echinofusca TaxID=47858 RepID=A0ABS3VKS3_MICEH|nr:hypothetical protein [Micromonospora echinofusca]MBO4205133.1 hypothetical protein [Micromonospora echinofusca]
MVTVEGLPPFEVIDAPPGIRCWGTDAPAVRWDGGRDVRVYVVREDDEPDLPEGIDPGLIRGVVGNLDGYLHAALAYLQASVLADPEFFGLGADDVAAYEALEPHELPLSEPELTFRTGDEWDLRFGEGSIPICDPYGIVVTFDRDRPVRVEDLSEAEDA